MIIFVLLSGYKVSGQVAKYVRSNTVNLNRDCCARSLLYNKLRFKSAPLSFMIWLNRTGSAIFTSSFFNVVFCLYMWRTQSIEVWVTRVMGDNLYVLYNWQFYKQESKVKEEKREEENERYARRLILRFSNAFPIIVAIQGFFSSAVSPLRC